MRHFGWKAGSLFNFLHSDGIFSHKISSLRFFFSNTVRDYVLVGDSGEKDPEIYVVIAREYPDRVRAIFIRAIDPRTFLGVQPNPQRYFYMLLHLTESIFIYCVSYHCIHVRRNS